MSDTQDDFTPLDIPQTILDGSFSGLEGADRDAFLDQMFADTDAEALSGIGEDIVAEIMLLNENRSPENVDRMAQLASYLDVVEAEQGRRAEAQAQLDAAADDIASRFAGDGTEAAEDESGMDREDEDEATASTENEGEQASAAETAPVEAAAKPSGSGLAKQLAAMAADSHAGNRVESARPTVLADAPAAPTAADEALARLSLAEGSVRFFTTEDAASSWAKGIETGQEIGSMEQLGLVVWGKFRALQGKHPQGVKDARLSLVRGTIDYGERALGDDFAHNLQHFTALRSDVTTIVASGGSCAPAAPRYDIYQLVEPRSPVEDNLPVVGAPRGAIRYTVPPDFREMRAGIQVTTDAQDAAGYGSGSGQAPPKPCVHVDCPEIAECVVSTVSWCIEFGNLTFETFPEFVAYRMRDIVTNFVSVKEVFYLNGIDAGSCLQTYDSAYGVSRAVPRHVQMARHNYIKRNNMDLDSRLDWYAPDWLASAHATDKRNDFSEGVNQMPSLADVTAEYEALGLNVVWYYDSASGEDQSFSDLCEDGPANEYPTEAVWYLHAPGTFIRLDAGTLDLGIVRDSVLNRTNDLQIFAEQWIQVCKIGLDSVKGISQDLCPSGAAPAAAELLTCAAS